MMAFIEWLMGTEGGAGLLFFGTCAAFLWIAVMSACACDSRD